MYSPTESHRDLSKSCLAADAIRRLRGAVRHREDAQLSDRGVLGASWGEEITGKNLGKPGAKP